MPKKGQKQTSSARKKIGLAHKGKKYSAETRKKIGLASKGRIPWNKGKTGIYSRKTLKQMRLSQEGKKQSAKSNTKRSKTLKKHYKKNPQKPPTKKIRKRIGRTLKKYYGQGNTPWNKDKKGVMPTPWNKGLVGKDNPFYGIKHSLRTRRAVSKGLMGHYMSDKTKKKIGDANRGLKRSEEYVIQMGKRMKGNKNPFYGKKHSKEAKRLNREARLSRVLPTKDSAPEKKMHQILKKAKIKFKKHLPMLGQPDIFIKPDLVIFVDGDYWHANPKHYKPNHVIIGNVKAKDIWKKDKKMTEYSKKQGYRVLRLWENKINSEPEKCLQKIIKIIKESRR